MITCFFFFFFFFQYDRIKLVERTFSPIDVKSTGVLLLTIGIRTYVYGTFLLNRHIMNGKLFWIIDTSAVLSKIMMIESNDW